MNKFNFSGEQLLQILDKTWVQWLLLLVYISAFVLLIWGVDHWLLRTLIACAMGLLLLVGYEHCRPIDSNERQLLQLTLKKQRKHSAILCSYRWRMHRELGRLMQS